MRIWTVRHEEVQNVPEDEVGSTVQDFVYAGAAQITATDNNDGSTFTVRATFSS